MQFEPRFTPPANYDYHYYSDNPFSWSGNGLPNCTCYAYGRIYEIMDCKPDVYRHNAKQWFDYNKDNHIYPYGYKAKLGAIAVYNGIMTDENGETYGHVAVVEDYDDETYTVSESNYGGEYFLTETFTYENDTHGGLIGFIYPFNFEGGEDVTREDKDIYTTCCTIEYGNYLPDQRTLDNCAELISDDDNFYGDLSLVDNYVKREAFVKNAYRLLLGRELDDSGYETFVKGAMLFRDITKAIINSDEYKERS